VDVAAVVTSVTRRMRKGPDGSAAVSQNGRFTAREAPEHDMTLADLPVAPNTDDLFSLANAICSCIDAPVTIEDSQSRVLAFSSRQDVADAMRIATVLGLRVPDAHVSGAEPRAVLRELAASRRACYFDPTSLGGGDVTLGRVAVAVRAGDILLGYIWAATDAPLSPPLEEWLLQAADIVAVHLQQLAMGTDREQQRLTDRVGALLRGGPDSRGIATELGLSSRPSVVVGMDVRPAGQAREEPSRAMAVAERLRTALAVHLAVVSRGAVVADLGPTIFAVVPVRGPDGADFVATSCRDFLVRADRAGQAVIGVSGVAAGPGDLPRARAEVQRALRVLGGARPGEGDRVALSVDVEIDALLLELRHLCEEHGIEPNGAFARLFAYDAQKGTDLLGTVRAWLDSHGDTVAAAEAQHVHPNTFRYRLRRAHEIGKVDLAHPQERFALDLQFRLFGPDPGSPR
jgi:DNA-binding PucR family transcriptional regulator